MDVAGLVAETDRYIGTIDFVKSTGVDISDITGDSRIDLIRFLIHSEASDESIELALTGLRSSILAHVIHYSTVQRVVAVMCSKGELSIFIVMNALRFNPELIHNTAMVGLLAELIQPENEDEFVKSASTLCHRY